MVGGANVVVAAAQSQLGKPYAWAKPVSATDPNPKSFDCSGLAMWCYRRAGVSLGHQTNIQYRQLKHRPFSEALPGDLIFFGTLADLYHVAIYVGNQTIIEAPDFGIPVRYRTINSKSPGLWHTVGAFPGAQSTSGGAKPVTYQDFFSTVLQRMGLPVTRANLRALARVTIIEGTNDRWNPLNSVVQSGDSQSFNSVGVQDYGSYQNGVIGTIKLLQGQAWSNVVSALRLGNSEGGVINAFRNTYASWGSHPSFDSVSDSRADSLLTQSMGTAVNTPQTVPAPYPLSALKVPLTAKQRADIIHYMNATSYKKAKASDSDAHLIEIYHEALVYYHLDPNNPQQQDPNVGGDDITDAVFGWADTLGKILSWLSSADNWKRIGLFALGAIVLIFATIEFARST